MSHYFINDKNLKDNINIIHHEFNGEKLSFKTNSGVFSKGEIDYASNLLINQLPQLTGNVLDMGCGYGLIGISLGKVMDINIDMADVNERCVFLSRENAINNGVKANVIHSDCFENISDKYDYIITNPPIRAGKDIVFKIYSQAKEHLLPKGKLYIVIQEKHGAKSSINKIYELFGDCNIIYKKKGYYVLCGENQ